VRFLNGSGFPNLSACVKENFLIEQISEENFLSGPHLLVACGYFLEKQDFVIPI
jgi:hypothetical protein